MNHHDADYRFGSSHMAHLVGLATPGHHHKLPRAQRREFEMALRGFDWFAGASENDVAELAEAAHEFGYPANWVVLSAWTTIDHCMFVTSGSLRVITNGIETGVLTAGDVVGAQEFFGGHPARSTIVTSTPVAGIAIPVDALASYEPAKAGRSGAPAVSAARPQTV